MIKLLVFGMFLQQRDRIKDSACVRFSCSVQKFRFIAVILTVYFSVYAEQFVSCNVKKISQPDYNVY